jgi:endonuclease G
MLISILFSIFLQVLPVGIFNISGASSASTTNFLSVKKGYAMSYDGKLGKANWVAWTLTSTDMGDVPRTNKFKQDDSMPRGFVIVDEQDYKYTGFDRGHLCNSEDRTSTYFLNEETFLMSNMLPQTPQLNRGPWERLEAYCRKLAKRGQKLVIYAGGIGAKDRLGSTGVPIPVYCWKVIYTPEKTWCLLFPNGRDLHPNWQTYSVPLAQLEKMTGYNFP